jgi:hypothetical protein
MAQTAAALVSSRSLTRSAPRRDQDVAALDLLLTGGRACDKVDCFSGSAVHVEGLGTDKKLNTFVTENPLQPLRDVGIFPGHELRLALDDRHAATEATVSLSQFEADIAYPEYDQMWW